MSLLPRFDEHPTPARAAAGSRLGLLLISIALAGCTGSPAVDTPDGAVPADGDTTDFGDFEGLLYADDFEDAISDDWTVAEGSWATIVDGSQVWQSQLSDPLSRASVGSADWTHYRAEVRIKTVEWADPAVPGAAGVMARFVDLQNYYFFVFSANELRIKKQVNGVFTTLATKPYTQAPGTWYTLRAHVVGPTLELYVDGTLELSATDRDLPAGAFGLLAGHGDTRYDDVLVRSLPAPDPDTDPGTPTHVTYGYTPPSQTVHGSPSEVYVVPAGYIHQTAWASSSRPDVLGVYAHDFGTFRSLVWRWADTMRPEAIQHVTGPGGKPAYRFEVSNVDTSSPGTSGNNPRAELFSVSAAEDRREIVPPRDNILRDGDEYWATWAMYLAPDFPLNHQWSTLIQRKFQNGVDYRVNWFSINAHGDTIDYGPPGAPKDTYIPFSTVTALRGRWTQFTIHERMSSGPDGLFELYMDGQLVGTRTGATIQPGDINHNFHYGYYRTNSTMPGVGVIYFSPFMISRTADPGPIPLLP